MRLDVCIINHWKDIASSSAYVNYKRDYQLFHAGLGDDEVPAFHAVMFRIPTLHYVRHSAEHFTVFIDAQIATASIGQIDYLIYTLTGWRGDEVKVSSLEFIGSPRSQLKKYLLRRV